ncbi:MAG: hypothetical protein R2731_18365 [Nocardioides sp.]
MLHAFVIHGGWFMPRGVLSALLGLVATATSLFVLPGAVPPAAAAPCQPLGPADLAFTAPHLTGELAQGDPGVCYTLAEAAGTVLQVNSPTPDVNVEVLAADDSPVCYVNWPGTCELTGPAPYSLRVFQYFGDPSPYDVQAYRLTGDTGCSSLSPAHFGSAGDQVSSTLAWHQTDCRTLDLAAHPHLVQHVSPNSEIAWTLYSSSGAPVCSPDGGDRCAVPQAGSYRLVSVGFQEPYTDPVTFRLKVLDLADVTGCGGPVSTSWLQPALRVAPTDRLQVDCREVVATAGDRLAFGGQTLLYDANPRALLVDAAGDLACSQAYAELGCVTGGPEPYRLVTWVSYGTGVPRTDYDAAVRDVGPSSDCPVISPAAFGTTPADVHPRVGCRRFAGTAGDAVLLRPVAASGPVDGRLYDPAGAQTCDWFTVPRCSLALTGDYTLVTSLFAATHTTVLHDLASDAGCVAQPLYLTARAGSLTAGRVDCALLAPATGSSRGVVHVDRDPGVEVPVTVVDATGRGQCTTAQDTYGYQSCTLSGTAPFRAVVGIGGSGRYRVGYLDPDDLGACTPVRPGAVNGRVRFARNQLAHCFRATPAAPAKDEFVNALRTAGSGKVEIAGFTSERLWCGNQNAAEQATMLCSATAAGSGYGLVAISDGVAGSFRIGRVAEVGQVPNWRRPAIVGKPRVGHRVRADPGDWLFWWATIDYTYRWFADGARVRGVRTASFKVPRRLAGAKLKVRVTASYPGRTPGVATSTAKRVRR